MELTSTANLVEVLVTVVAIAATTAHTLLLGQAIQDRQSQIRRKVNGGKRLLTIAAMRRQSINALVQLCFVGAGAYSMFLPPNPAATRSFGAYLVAGLLLVAETLLVVNAIRDYLDREMLLEWIGDHRIGPPAP
jgi:hypothetical protein